MTFDQWVTTAPLEVLALHFVLVLTRISSLFATLPVFSLSITPVRIRVALMLALSLCVAFSLPITPPPPIVSFALFSEFMLGAAMGLVVRITFAAIEFAGEIAAMQMGLGFARLLDPSSSEQSGALAQLYMVFASLMMFATNSHHAIFRALNQSFILFPVGHAKIPQEWVWFLSERIGEIFLSGFRIGLPVIFVAFITQICFALLTRVAPQLNLWAIGFLFTVAVGFIGLLLYAPTTAVEIEYLMEHSAVTLEQLLLAGAT